MSEATLPASEAPNTPNTPTPPPVKKRSAWRWLWRLLLLIALLLAIVAGTVVWIARSESGTAWLLSRVPMLKITGPHGVLFGDFSADRIEVDLPPGSDKIVLTQLAWKGLSLSHLGLPLGRPFIHLDSLQVARLDIQITPDPNAPKTTPHPPATLGVPVEFEVKSLQVGELHMTALGDRYLRQLQAHVHIGADGGETHRIDDLSLGFDRLLAKGQLKIGTESPFNLATQLQVAPDPAIPVPPDAGLTAQFDASLGATGPLDKLDITARLRGVAPAGRPAGDAPSLDASATVMPFAAWPLGRLDARTQSLDLSALSSAAPATSLSGSATANTAGLNAPATVTLAIDNARAGRVDEGLLPVRSLRAEVQGRPDDPTRFELRSLTADLGGAKESAGGLSASGQWATEAATLALKLVDIRPRELDVRAPEMRIGGSLDLRGESLIAQANGTPAAPKFNAQGALDGALQWEGKAQKVHLELDGGGTLTDIDLRKLIAQAGASRASLSGTAKHAGDGAAAGWQVAANGALNDLDPRVWWPGPPGSAWRAGPHRFNAALVAKLQIPDDLATRKTALAQVSALRGDATLTLTNSLIAGTPLAGEINVRSNDSKTSNARATISIADAKLDLQGRLDGSAAGTNDHWELTARDADLVKLAPLIKLAQATGAPSLALTGQIDAQATVDGRWPKMTTSGNAEVKQLAVEQTRLDAATLRWKLGTAANAPLDVDAQLTKLTLPPSPTDANATAETHPPQTLDTAHLTLQGSFADHRLSLTAASPVRPPAWIDLLQSPPRAQNQPADAAPTTKPGDGSVAELHAQGALQFDTAMKKPLHWHGALQQLNLRGRDSTAPAWLSISETPLDIQYDPQSGIPKVDAGAGRAQLPGAAVRWSQLAFVGGPTPVVNVQATLDPIAVTPLLARLQPDFGWKGDLVVAGQFNIRSAPSVFAQIEIARQSGDLSVTDESGHGQLALGLSDLRVALDANNGLWQTSLAFAGKTLGSMAGAITVRTDPKALVPAADAPLQGNIEANVANLGAWAAWVPAGWRLGGKLHAAATVNGRFGAPEYTGKIDGSGLGVRNLLQGVNLHDGELAVSLQGETATIDKFTARAGDGSVDISGRAGFGASPQAQIKLVADKLQLLGRIDRRIVASGNAQLGLNAEAVKLDGQFNIDEGLIDFSQGDAPSLGDDVQVVSDKPAAATAPAAPPEKPRQIAMNVNLDLGQQLKLKGRGLETQLRGKLAISAPGGKLAVNGIVRTANGTYAAYRQKLDIERGLIAFSGPVDNPRLDILATRPNLDVNVGVAISGTALNPRVRLYSDPDMSDTDKLSWLVLGKAPDTLGNSDTALLQSAALALLSGEGSSPTDDLTKRLGLDDLSVGQQSDGTVKETVVSLGKKLSDRWYLGYERSLTSTAGSWQLIYRVAQRFTLKAQSGADNSLDAIWTWRWN